MIGSLCILLRWGAMDAEAYPEASKTVLKILWDIATTTHVGHKLQWAKARASAFEALTQYEVISWMSGQSYFSNFSYCDHLVPFTSGQNIFCSLFNFAVNCISVCFWHFCLGLSLNQLTFSQVSHIDKNILDFKQRSFEFLFSETNPVVLRAMEGFQVKIITHEHT